LRHRRRQQQKKNKNGQTQHNASERERFKSKKQHGVQLITLKQQPRARTCTKEREYTSRRGAVLSVKRDFKEKGYGVRQTVLFRTVLSLPLGIITVPLDGARIETQNFCHHE
jgi:hypothetical protein